MRHGLKNGSKSLEAGRDVEEVDGEEEVVEVSQHREGEVPGCVEEGLQQTGNYNLASITQELG